MEIEYLPIGEVKPANESSEVSIRQHNFIVLRSLYDRDYEAKSNCLIDEMFKLCPNLTNLEKRLCCPSLLLHHNQGQAFLQFLNICFEKKSKT